MYIEVTLNDGTICCFDDIMCIRYHEQNDTIVLVDSYCIPIVYDKSEVMEVKFYEKEIA